MVWSVPGLGDPFTQHGHWLLSLLPQFCTVGSCLGGPEALEPQAISGQPRLLPASALTRDSHSGSSRDSLALRLFLLEG